MPRGLESTKFQNFLGWLLYHIRVTFRFTNLSVNSVSPSAAGAASVAAVMAEVNPVCMLAEKWVLRRSWDPNQVAFHWIETSFRKWNVMPHRGCYENILEFVFYWGFCFAFKFRAIGILGYFGQDIPYVTCLVADWCDTLISALELNRALLPLMFVTCSTTRRMSCSFPGFFQ